MIAVIHIRLIDHAASCDDARVLDVRVSCGNVIRGWAFLGVIVDLEASPSRSVVVRFIRCPEGGHAWCCGGVTSSRGGTGLQFLQLPLSSDLGSLTGYIVKHSILQCSI